MTVESLQTATGHCAKWTSMTADSAAAGPNTTRLRQYNVPIVTLHGVLERDGPVGPHARLQRAGAGAEHNKGEDEGGHELAVRVSSIDRLISGLEQEHRLYVTNRDFADLPLVFYSYVDMRQLKRRL